MSADYFDFTIVGAGIFGLSAAYSLSKRGFSVCVLNDSEIPTPSAASTDISKIVRLEYGSDLEYMNMAQRSLASWRRWNDIFEKEFEEKVFHETGFLLLCKSPIEQEAQSFESESRRLLMARGFKVKELNASEISESYPAFNSEVFVSGFYNPLGGFVESAKAVGLLKDHLISKGVVIQSKSRVRKLKSKNDQVGSLVLDDGSEIQGDQFIFCAGSHTPSLLEMEDHFSITGHPIFHLEVPPSLIEKFSSNHFPVFSADISKTGWYGFPVHPDKGIVKIARHGKGIPVDPHTDSRKTTDAQEKALRSFLRECIPELAEAKITNKRLCYYTDTLDGHFWIDHHHVWKNVVVASGGSGHGFKMGPELGEMIASTALGEKHAYSDRYLARSFETDTTNEEQARSGS